MNDVLRKFLELGLLDIGEDDEKYLLLEKASQELMKKLQRRKADIIPFVLIALDPNAAPEEPVFRDVEFSLRKYWATYVNRYTDPPLQLFRAIILNALQEIGKADPHAAAIIWLVGGNYIPHAKLDREAEVCNELIIQMGNIAEAEAVKLWSGSPQLHLPEPPQLSLKSGEGNIEAPGLDEAFLTQRMAAAVGPSAQGITLTAPVNAQWANSPQSWAYEFAPIAAKGITSATDSAMGELAEATTTYVGQALSEWNKQLAAYISEVNQAFADIIEQGGQEQTSLALRTCLLWWKETLYSNSLRRSYRHLRPVLAVVAMAVDLHNQVPDFCPQSVEFLLRETLADVKDITSTESIEVNGQAAMSMSEILDAYTTSDLDIRILLPGSASADRQPGRITLLACIEYALAGDAECAQDPSALTGIDERVKLTFEELAVWLFRDLQARRIATKADKPKRK
jgi:hypothetical protein